MPRHQTNRQPARPVCPDLKEFWQDQIRTLGRKVYFVDTGGILNSLESADGAQFFDSIIGVQLTTSTYVLAETVRRIVKAKHPGRFVGPAGETGARLAIHLLNRWLTDYSVEVICPPKAAFDAAKEYFSSYRERGIDCDLADVISYVIVCGLEQGAIVSPDGHFQRMGLQLLPGG